MATNKSTIATNKPTNESVDELIYQLSEALSLCEAYAGEQTESIINIIEESNKVCKKMGFGEPFEVQK